MIDLVRQLLQLCLQHEVLALIKRAVKLSKCKAMIRSSSACLTNLWFVTAYCRMDSSKLDRHHRLVGELLTLCMLVRQYVGLLS